MIHERPPSINVFEPKSTDGNGSTAPVPVLTITDVAEILQCSKTHVSNLLKGKVQGVPKLTHFALGRRKLVRREWLEEWLETNKHG